MKLKTLLRKLKEDGWHGRFDAREMALIECCNKITEKELAIQQEPQVSFAEPNQLSKVFELFIKAAKSQKAWLDESYLQHSILCNYPHTHNKDDATFCNCGLTDLQYALREYDKLCKK